MLAKPTETALVNHVVKWRLFREQGRHLNTQVKPLDVDLAVGALACNDQKAEPVDVPLEISIGLMRGNRMKDLFHSLNVADVSPWYFTQCLSK